MNEDWKEGFSQGFNKGYNEGYEKGKREHQQVNNPFLTIPYEGKLNSCSVCGIKFTDSLGNPTTMGYVCNHPQCPSKMMCSVGPSTSTTRAT